MSSTCSNPSKPCCAPDCERDSHPESTALLTPSCESEADVLSRMVRLEGGPFLMGTDYKDAFTADGEGPVREITIPPFLIDRYPVTNELFARFVAATEYKTEAELFGWSFVFWTHIPKRRYADLVQNTVAAAPWWCIVPGATWNTPEGPTSNIRMRANYPVVHVSWNDAQAFCAWSSSRLLTEAEWEYAARGGLKQKLYPWGDQLRPGGQHLCNIWQGKFPNIDTAEDGYAGASPVDAFPPNGYGLFSITGNAWEWCADWFSNTHHQRSNAPHLNPIGPPTGTGRVIKGGSFLCHKSYYNRYRVAARSSNTPDSSTSNMSFRCARSI